MRPPIYVITIKRRQDRRDRLLPQLGKERVFLSYDIGGDLDATQLTIDDFPDIQLFDWQIPSDNFWWNRPLKLGEICCALNHANCWDDAIAQNYDSALFLEDDAVFAPGANIDMVMDNISEISKLDSTWDLLYLGREALAPDRSVIGNFVIPGYSFCTHAIAFSRAGLRKMVQLPLKKMMMPLDEFLPAAYARHPRDDVAAAVPIILRAYAVRDDLLIQKDSNDSETERTAFIHQNKNTPT